MDAVDTAPSGPDLRPVPTDIRRWNWGAFLLNWVWGIGNNTWIALLCFVPGVGFVMPFVLGFKGNEWAWRNARWDSVGHFQRVQRGWAIAGVAVWAMSALLIAGVVGGVIYTFNTSEPYQMAVAQLQANADATAALGTPIKTGWVGGSMRTKNATGHAEFTFTAEGPRGSGEVLLEADKARGVWTLKQLKLRVDRENRTIDLLTQTRVQRFGWPAES
jgi:hypothetical protein